MWDLIVSQREIDFEADECEEDVEEEKDEDWEPGAKGRTQVEEEELMKEQQIGVEEKKEEEKKGEEEGESSEDDPLAQMIVKIAKKNDNGKEGKAKTILE